MADNDNNKTVIYGRSDNNKTETYDSSENHKTSLYNSKQQETAAYSILQNKQFKSKTHGIGIGDKLFLKKKEYLINEIISEGTGEATIYKVEDSNKNIFALKLYFEFNNYKEEPNFETLNRIRGISDPDILKLYDFGVGVDKYQGRYCYEISDYAEGGDLLSVPDFKAKYTKNNIEKNIVPEIFGGIKKLHEFKIYHCDLKPSNIFFKDKNQNDLLIGDYGSAKAYEISIQREVVMTSLLKTTDFYNAPESRLISEKYDYYSFGMILLHLFYPDRICLNKNYRIIDKQKSDNIKIRQEKSSEEYPNLDNVENTRLNTLIAGLTLYNRSNRWGKEEVEKWLAGENVELKYQATETSSVQPVKLGYSTIRSDKDFIELLETRETWWEDLFEDVDTYSALKAWIGSYQDISSRKIFDKMIHYYKPYGKEFVRESAIRYFNPEREIIIDMNSFNFFNSSNIKKDVEACISKLDIIWKITSIDKIKFYLFQIEFSLNQLKNAVSKDNEIIVSSLIDKLLSVFGIVQKSFNDYKTEIQSKLV